MKIEYNGKQFTKIKILASECEDCQKTCFDKKIEKENEQLKQQLAEKEELLKNAPKYRIGQRVYISLLNSIITEIKIDECDIKYRLYDWKQWFNEDDIFATKEEAQKKLEELI